MKRLILILFYVFISFFDLGENVDSVSKKSFMLSSSPIYWLDRTFSICYEK